MDSIKSSFFLIFPEFFVLFCQLRPFQQFRPTFQRPFQRLFPAPFFNVAVVARQKHFRNLLSSEGLRPCILGIFQQSVLKRLIFRGNVVVQYPGSRRDMESIITMAGSSPPVRT